MDTFPADLDILAQCQPVYESHPGWKEDISSVKQFRDLPLNAKRYVQRVEELTRVPVDIVSVGPGREETIVISNPFA